MPERPQPDPNLDGAVIRTVSVPGHNDGLRIDPATHLVWATSNEDANPVLSVIDPAIDRITLLGSTVALTPVLMGNAGPSTS